MVTNKGQQGSLFRGAFMNSGAPTPIGSIVTPRSQAVFDQVSKAVGCTEENKTLACMRLVPYLALKAAIEQTPSILTCKQAFIVLLLLVAFFFFVESRLTLLA
jgi:acetylcholinesterase